MERVASESSLGSDFLSEAVARIASDAPYLGAFDQMYALFQMFGSEVCERLDDPEMDQAMRADTLIEITEPYVEKILADEGTWYSGDRLKHQLELADETNAGPDLGFVLRQFFYQYAIDIGKMIAYAETPGVLPEQWDWQPHAMNEQAALILHGIEIEDNEEFEAYNDFVSGRTGLPSVPEETLQESEDRLEMIRLVESSDEAYEVELRQAAMPPINVVINMPEQKPQDVVVHNHIEAQKPPDVVVNPVVNINPEIVMPKPKEVIVQRDTDGKITGLLARDNEVMQNAIDH
jgi:hypothetical protein